MIAFLATPEVAAEDKKDACKSLASCAKDIPVTAQNQLRDSIVVIADSKTMLDGGNPARGIANMLAASLDCLSSSQLADKATRLLHGLPADRQAVCHLSRHMDAATAVSYLMALARDDHIQVRGMAAARLINLITEQNVTETVFAVIQNLRGQDGCVMPLALLDGLRDRGVYDAFAESMIAEYSAHRSAIVRRTAISANNGLHDCLT